LSRYERGAQTWGRLEFTHIWDKNKFTLGDIGVQTERKKGVQIWRKIGVQIEGEKGVYLFEIEGTSQKLKDLSADIQQILRGSNADKHQVVRFYTVRRHPTAVERLEWKKTKDEEIFQ
jgi:hypothetical protein